MADQRRYVVQPLIRQGNYYLHSESWSSRSQAFTNLYLRPWKGMGKHQFTIGGRVDRVLGLNRERIERIYRGKPAVAEANWQILQLAPRQ